MSNLQLVNIFFVLYIIYSTVSTTTYKTNKYKHTQQLKKEEETNQEVTWEDQQKINKFSQLNVGYNTLEELYKEKKVCLYLCPLFCCFVKRM